MIDSIMLFAAGLGTRMQSQEKNIPKPLVTLKNKPIIHYVLEFIIKSQRFKKIVINTHFLAYQIEASIEKFKKENFTYLSSKEIPQIIIVYEKDLLDVGGGLKNAYEHFKDKKEVFTINSDSIIKSKHDVFLEMEKKWDRDKMDFLMLLNEKNNVVGQVTGEFDIDQEYKLHHGKDFTYTYTGLQILNPSLVKNYPETVFSLHRLQINPKYRAYGCINEGYFYHANSREHLKNIEEMLG